MGWTDYTTIIDCGTNQSQSYTVQGALQASSLRGLQLLQLWSTVLDEQYDIPLSRWFVIEMGNRYYFYRYRYSKKYRYLMIPILYFSIKLIPILQKIPIFTDTEPPSLVGSLRIGHLNVADWWGNLRVTEDTCVYALMWVMVILDH